MSLALGSLLRVVWELDPQLLVLVGSLLKGQDHLLHGALVHRLPLHTIRGGESGAEIEQNKMEPAKIRRRVQIPSHVYKQWTLSSSIYSKVHRLGPIMHRRRSVQLDTSIHYTTKIP